MSKAERSDSEPDLPAPTQSQLAPRLPKEEFWRAPALCKARSGPQELTAALAALSSWQGSRA
jgi:hypothetical protein